MAIFIERRGGYGAVCFNLETKAIEFFSDPSHFLPFLCDASVPPTPDANLAFSELYENQLWFEEGFLDHQNHHIEPMNFLHIDTEVTSDVPVEEDDPEGK